MNIAKNAIFFLKVTLKIGIEGGIVYKWWILIYILQEICLFLNIYHNKRVTFRIKYQYERGAFFKSEPRSYNKNCPTTSFFSYLHCKLTASLL